MSNFDLISMNVDTTKTFYWIQNISKGEQVKDSKILKIEMWDNGENLPSDLSNSLDE